MARRSGVTLLEVLVAIFVMGIGLLALLTLFPLGALRMAKALQDEKCAQSAGNARAVSIMKSIPWDGNVNPSYTTLVWPTNPPQTFFANNNYPSFPVFVDPIGFNSSTGLVGQTNVAGGTGPVGQPLPQTQPYSFITRTSVSFVQILPQDTNQWFTVQDDIIFENAAPGPGNSPSSLPNLLGAMPGQPQLLLPGPYNQKPLFTPMTFSRDTRYSYGLMIQLPRSSDTSVVNTAVVVYNKRNVTPTAASLTLPEYLYNAIYNLTTNTITLDYSIAGTVPPPLRIGDWVMDNTFFAIPNQAPNVGTAHCGFYRVVGLTDLGNSQLELEVDQPIRGWPANTTVVGGTAIVLDGVAEVYNLGTQRLP